MWGEELEGKQAFWHACFPGTADFKLTELQSLETPGLKHVWPNLRTSYKKSINFAHIPKKAKRAFRILLLNVKKINAYFEYNQTGSDTPP